MLQQTIDQRMPERIVRPRRLDIFLHAKKTARLIGSLVKDRRIPVIRKVFFFGAIIALLAILLFPDTIEEIGLTAIMPVVGTILGVPLDAGFDWAIFAMAGVSLLRFFPAEIVSEHYSRIFNR